MWRSRCSQLDDFNRDSSQPSNVERFLSTPFPPQSAVVRTALKARYGTWEAREGSAPSLEKRFLRRSLASLPLSGTDGATLLDLKSNRCRQMPSSGGRARLQYSSKLNYCMILYSVRLLYVGLSITTGLGIFTIFLGILITVGRR